MVDFKNLTPRQHNKMCDLCMSDPVPLGQADLTRPFVYERQHGVFYVTHGFHTNVMSFLLALQNGLENGVEVADLLKLRHSSGTADHWLEHTPGAAFLSSVGKHIQVGTGRGLTAQERRLFGDFRAVFDPL